jgi:hypothetical protein
MPALHRVATTLPDVHVRAFLDDVVLFSRDPSKAERAFLLLTEELRRIGLEVNREKTEAHGDDSHGIATRCGLKHSPDGIRLLGAAVTKRSSFVQDLLSEKLVQYERFFGVIPKVPQPLAFSLLRACGPARWTYLAKVHPPALVGEAHRNFDKRLLDAVGGLMGVDASELSAEARKLISLPERMGGMGMTTYADICEMCFASSTKATLRKLHDMVEDHHKANMESLSERAQRRCGSTKAPTSRLWLDPRTGRKAQSFALALQHRIGVTPAASDTTTCPGCSTLLQGCDADAHALGCARWRGANATTRHNDVVNALAASLTQLGVPVSKERDIAPGLTMDLEVDLGSSVLWLDATVLATDAKKWAKMSTDEAGRRKALEKQRHYEAAASAANLPRSIRERGGAKVEFHPLVFDVHAAPSPASLTVLRRIARELEVELADFVRPAVVALQEANGDILRKARRAFAENMKWAEENDPGKG